MTRPAIVIGLADEAASARLGEDLAAMLRPGDVLALSGDLGAGKTTLARAIIRALAGDPALEVPSPTFTLVQAYALRVPVQHFDLYRLGSADELEELGFPEAAEEGTVLVEWPERAGGALPDGTVQVALTEDGAGRLARIAGPDEFMGRLERSLEIRRFLADAGMADSHRRFLVGDASSRAYETVFSPGQTPIILMNAPRRPDGPPIRDGKPYSQIAHLAESVTPFVAIAGILRSNGFAAPRIPAADLDRGLLLVEDLGRDGVLDVEGRPIGDRYVACAELLADLHAVAWPSRVQVEGGGDHVILAYDLGAMTIETELLVDWYLPHAAGRPASDAERAAYAAAWLEAFSVLEGAERSLVLRDFHSPNIIWRGDRSGRDRIGLIDFQDAMIGPSAYDVASLAMDARVTIDVALEQRIVEAYCAARTAAGPFDRAGFDTAYAIMAAQRNAKILGIFVRLDRRDGKPAYLRHLPRIQDYFSRALAHPSLERLATFCAEAGIIGRNA